jgi:1,4-alpha-glucan branching enzyme
MVKKIINKNISGKLKETKSEKQVEFIFHAPEAKSVYLAGEFNNWDIQSIPMKKGNTKDWKTTINLSSGRYEYKYFVDGTWAENIPDVEKVPNDFGTQNFVIHVK